MKHPEANTERSELHKPGRDWSSYVRGGYILSRDGNYILGIHWFRQRTSLTDLDAVLLYSLGLEAWGAVCLHF